METFYGIHAISWCDNGYAFRRYHPAVLPYLMEKLEIDIDEMINVLNKKSGLLGLTGLSSDMRDLEKTMKKNTFV